jgi:hypothetical protein
MRVGLLRWIVLFFTRPIRLSDGPAMVRRLKARRKPGLDEDDFAETRLVRRGDGAAPDERWRDTHSEIVVTEQPLDTLPAELQDELRQEKKKPFT